MPAGTDVREAVREWDNVPPTRQSAVLRVRSGAGYGIRRYATRQQPGDGWDQVEVGYSDPGWFAEHVASFGPDVIVMDPADLRDAVMARLKGALA